MSAPSEPEQSEAFLAEKAPEYLKKQRDAIEGVQGALQTLSERQAMEEEGTAEPYLIHDGWPGELEKSAYRGVAGEIIRALEPHTEADSAALLVQLLVGIGNIVGRQKFFQVEADQHYGNLFVVIVGKSSKARKGSAWGRVRWILQQLDSAYADRIPSGLASGEGLLYLVRDDIEKTVLQKDDRGKVLGRETIVTECGVEDKRLLIVEPEFAQILRASGRDGNTLSVFIRQAWDNGNLRNCVKNSPLKSTGSHISIIGHITVAELKACLTNTDALNGFGNRFLWICSRRSKTLPMGGKHVDVSPLVAKLQNCIEFARISNDPEVLEVPFDPAAEKLWIDEYARLTRERAGLFGALTSRAEAQVRRLALIYAVLDRSFTIGREHLLAALEVWRYVEDSVQFIFGSSTGNTLADEIYRAIKEAKDEGLTRTKINRTFSGRRKESEINPALLVLQEFGRAEARLLRTNGRPEERWFYKNL